MSLNLALGWVAGDDVRVLIAGGIPIGYYQTTQIQGDMNALGERTPTAVAAVRALLTQYETAQSALSALNASSDGRVLTRADVLEWSSDTSQGWHGPYAEMTRVRGLLAQYFGSSPLFSMNGYADATYIVRA